MTSSAFIRAELERFVASKAEEIICISGSWGVGKTHLWSSVIEAAKAKKAVGLDRYSYVSLFGIGSIESLKQSVFENTDRLVEVTSKEVKAPGKSWSAIKLFRRSAGPLSTIPLIGEYFKAGWSILFLDIKEQIVCFDDLERRGENLSVGEVLGLASFLKEQRHCKVVFLCNDDALKGESREQYQSHHEKVFDAYFQFTPTVQESAAVAIPGSDEISALVKTKCSALGIANIRLIKKAERLARLAYPAVSGLHRRVTEQLVSSIILFSWCQYEPHTAPSLEYLIKTRSNEFFDLMEDSNKSPEEISWNTLLREYGFGHLDDLDVALLEGVKSGYFDRDLVRSLAIELNRRCIHEDRAGSFDTAWDNYRYSFNDDEEAVVDHILDAFRKNVEFISPAMLNATMSLLKDVGRADQALGVLVQYMKEREEPASFWSISIEEPTLTKWNPELLDAFSERYKTLADMPDPKMILLKLGGTDSWDSSDVKVIASLSEEDLYEIFKTNDGPILRGLVRGALNFRRVSNPTPEMSDVTNKTINVLCRIGRETLINAQRIKMYGIDLKDYE